MTEGLRERSEFAEKEVELLLDHAERCVRAALAGEETIPFDDPLGRSQVVGVFVSLKRGVVLRSCCGILDEENLAPLGDVLTRAAQRAALNDVRFPRIHEAELPHLDIEVTVMHHLECLPSGANQRATSVIIGQHGLIISHDGMRGILLPQVASENCWDAPTFFSQVCRKANLPPNTWLQPEAVLKRFSGSIFHRAAEVRDVDFRELPDAVRTRAIDFVEAIVTRGEEMAGEIPPELLEIPVSPGGWGMLVQTASRLTEVVFRKEGSLGELIRDAARHLHQKWKPEANRIRDLLVFSHAIELHPDDYPKRHSNIQKGFAVSAEEGNRTSVVLKESPRDPVLQALKQIGQDPGSWKGSGVRICCHLFLHWNKPEKIADIPIREPEKNDGVRTPSVAGKFYPGSGDEMEANLGHLFAKCPGGERETVRAVLLPHAGWAFCGEIIAETLQRIHIPDTIVIVGPKHTPLGENWAVSRSRRWRIPGAEVPLDEESCAFIAAHIPGMAKDDLAHQREHGIEVLVPFFRHLNPSVRIVPIVVGSGTYEKFVGFGEALLPFRRRLAADGEDCLFVISSDLNHFAGEQENRRRDGLALEALQTGDSLRLWQVCQKHEISMCGLRPAVAVLNSLDIDPAYPGIEVVKYDTSARVTGDPSSVVGYAGALIR